MPSKNKGKGVPDKKIVPFGVLGRSTTSAILQQQQDIEDVGGNNKQSNKQNISRNNLHSSSAALPALAFRPRLIQRAYSTLSFGGCEVTNNKSNNGQTASDVIRIPLTKNIQDKTPSDRISLDKRCLNAIPNLTASEEVNVRLLSLQHNNITKLDGMPKLLRLVFLDLYDNQVDRLNGIGILVNLRVLLLGKNRVRRLDGLEGLSKLEVLDLHGNQLSILGNCLTSLTELKVLNVAGNQLRTIHDTELKGLDKLQEINLRRNRLKKLTGLAHVPNIIKLFLSNNNIQSIQELVNTISKAPICEISVDGNTVFEQSDSAQLYIISSLPSLQLLNGTQVGEELRTAAILWKTESNKDKNANASMSNAKMHWELLRSKLNKISREQSENKKINRKILMEIESGQQAPSTEISPLRLPPILVPLLCSSTENGRVTAISSSSSSDRSSTMRCDSVLSNSASSSVEPNVDSCTSSPRSEIAVKEPILIHSDEDNDIDKDIQDTAVSQHLDDINTQVSRPFTAQPAKQNIHANQVARNTIAVKQRSKTAKEKTTNHISQQNNIKNQRKLSITTGKTREQGGDYLVEIENKCLSVYGQTAIKFLDRPWHPAKAAEVLTVKFNYISYNSIATQFVRLRQKFPICENFIFKDTNIYCLAQLNALAELQGLSSLTIECEGNPIVQKDWKLYSVYRLSHWGLEKINGELISEEMKIQAESEYSSLSSLVLISLPGSLLLPLLGRLTLEAGQPGPPPSPTVAKEWLYTADPTLRTVVAKEALQWRKGNPSQEELSWRQKGKTFLTSVIDSGLTAAEKLKILEDEWPDILQSLIQDTLVDFSQIDTYMKKCITQL